MLCSVLAATEGVIDVSGGDDGVISCPSGSSSGASPGNNPHPGLAIASEVLGCDAEIEVVVL